MDSNGRKSASPDAKSAAGAADGGLVSRPAAALIPCFNEAAAIGALVREVQSHVNAVLVVDDGSTDGTGDIARAHGAQVIRHERRLGKGAALADGLKQLKTEGFARVLILDGDGQHLPSDIPRFFACARETGAQLVVGNRMGEARKIPWVRRKVNLWMSRRISRLAGVPLPDSQCGFRLLDIQAWDSVVMEASHFEVESEFLVTFVRKGFRVEFVPIQVIYGSERSKINPIVDTWRWVCWWRRKAHCGKRENVTKPTPVRPRLSPQRPSGA